MQRSLSLLLIGLLLYALAPSAQAQDFASLPFKQCWRFETENMSKFELASDNVQAVFLSLSDGNIIAIDAITGNPIWRSELGGEIISKILLSGEKLIVTTRDDADSLPGRFVVTALSAKTGVTFWQRSISDIKPEAVYLLSDSDRVMAITSNADVIYLGKTSGEEIGRKNLRLHITSEPQQVQNTVYFGTDAKNLLTYSFDPGQISKSVNVDSIPAIIGLNDSDSIVYGDKIGNVFAIRLNQPKRSWKARAGAEITGITKSDKGFVVTSGDNYAYLLAARNGKRLWKKRLDGRGMGLILKELGVAVFSTLNNDSAFFVNIANGKSVNQLLLGEDEYFVNKPILIGKQIIFPVNFGLAAYSSTGCLGK